MTQADITVVKWIKSDGEAIENLPPLLPNYLFDFFQWLDLDNPPCGFGLEHCEIVGSCEVV